MHNSYERMHEAHESSFFSSTLTACGLFVSLALLLLAPAPAQAQTCYAEADGNWSNADIWAPNAGGDPVGNNCDGGDGVPGSGETAVVTSNVSVDVASNNAVGTLDINDGAGGVFLNGGDLTVEGTATVGQSNSPGSATLNTFEDDDPGTLTASGKLTIEGSLTAYGDVKVFRQDGGTGELDVTGSNSTGDFTIESSGSFTGGPSAPANVAGTLTNNNADDSNIVSERCYVESNGSWGTAGNWAPIGGTDPARTCDLGGDGNGIPESGETAVLPDGNNFIDVTSNFTVGNVLVSDGNTGGLDLIGGDLTVEGIVNVGQSDPSDASVETHFKPKSGTRDSGKLTINGSASIYGTLDVDREDSGAGELEVTGTNGSGDVTVESGGVLDVNQVVSSSSAPISIAGDLINNGDLNQSETTLSVSGELNNSGTLDATNGANISASSLTNDGNISASSDISVTNTLTNNTDSNISTSGGTITVDDFTNNAVTNTTDGDTEGIFLNGGELSATGVGVQSDNDGNLTIGAGGTLDMAHKLTNGSSLDFSGATLEFANAFENNGTFTTNGESLTVFDGGGDVDQVLSGTLSGGSASFVDFRVEDDAGDNGSVVDPTTKVEVTGKLTVRPGNRYGTVDPQEKSDLRYEGGDFSVEGDLYANIVNFAAGNIESGTIQSYTTVSGAVFAEVNISNQTAVEVGSNSFTVFGLVDVFTESVLNVANENATLELAADINVDGDIEANSGTITFNGEGESTGCALGENGELDCSTSNNIQEYTGNSQTLNFLRIQDEDGDSTVETAVEFSDSGSPITVKASLIIDEATLTTSRPITIQNGDLDVSNGGNITFNNDRKLTFTGSGDNVVDTPGGLTVSVVEVSKGGSGNGTQTLNNDLTVTDRLLMTSGTLNPTQDLVVQNELVLGGPLNAPSTIDVSSNGTATLVSNQQNDAYVRYVDSDDDGTVDGSVNGPLTHQRELDGGPGWYYLTSPVGSSNDTFQALLEQGGDTDLRTVGLQGSDNPSFNEASVRLYDEEESGLNAGWKPIDCGSPFCESSGLEGTMNSGRGYIVYGFGTVSGGSAFPKIIDSDVEPRTNTKFDFSNSDGSPADGPGITANDNSGVSSGIDEEEGWNLLGNPYNAVLDFCTTNSGETGMTRGSGLSPSVYVWDPSNSTDGTSTSAYASYNCDTETGGGNSNDLDGSQNLPDGEIAPHQAFFVKANSTSNLKLSIDDITEAQANVPGNVFLKEKDEEDEKPPAVELQLAFDNAAYATSVGFVEGRKAGLDNSDGYYNGGSPENSGLSLYSVLEDGTSIVTNAMPRELSEEQTISLKVDACDYGSVLSGPASIEASTLRNLPPSWGLTLEDTQTETTVNLRDASSYSFELNGTCPSSADKAKSTNESSTLQPPTPSGVRHPVAKDGTPDTRFKLHIDPDANPPIELSRFVGESAERAATLKWTAARQRNIEGFYVQRKMEDGSFKTLDDAFVEGAGSGTTTESREYEYSIEDLDAGTHTFRLKQVSTEGGAMFSDPVDVKVGLAGEYKLQAYPNPVQRQATIEFAVKEEADVTIALYNTLGQKVQTVYRQSTPAEETRRVQLDTDALSSGAYFLRMRGGGVSATTRVTVVK